MLKVRQEKVRTNKVDLKTRIHEIKTCFSFTNLGSAIKSIFRRPWVSKWSFASSAVQYVCRLDIVIQNSWLMHIAHNGAWVVLLYSSTTELPKLSCHSEFWLTTWLCEDRPPPFTSRRRGEWPCCSRNIQRRLNQGMRYLHMRWLGDVDENWGVGTP